MDWNQNLVALAQDAGDSNLVSDPDFLAQIQRIVHAAERRIERDLDLLTTIVSDDSATLAPQRQQFILPTGVATFIVVESIQLMVNNVWQPPLDWISREAFPYVWPTRGAVGSPSIPRNIAPYDGASVLIGPAPDQSYGVHITGTQRPHSLHNGVTIVDDDVTITPGSPADTGTFISTELEDLFLAAEMIDVSAWQRLFSPQADEAAAPNWLGEYERLKTPALVVESRKKLQSVGWGSRGLTPAQMAKGGG